MKSFIKYILRGRQQIPPKKVLESFKIRFGESINIEWEKIKNEFEAIFYNNNIEQIARFDSNGELLSLKRNLTINNLNDKIAEKASSFGEIMNVIEISNKDTIHYEIIYRDNRLVRYSLLLDDKGNALSQNEL